jgi:hypothetical protein
MRSKLSFFKLATILVAFFAFSASAQDLGWHGNNPDADTFRISNEQQLMGLGVLVNEGGINFEGRTIILQGDIALTAPHIPIGNTSTRRFRGIFDGNGHTISNMSVEAAEFAGLFGNVGAGGQIKNLTVNANTIVGINAGGLAGIYASTMPIENSRVNIRDSIHTTPVIFMETFEGESHSFTLVNGNQTNRWVVGTAASFEGARSIYISNGTANNYNITATSVVHFFRDITFPASAIPTTLSFRWRGVGEACCDFFSVRLVETTVQPVASYQLTTGHHLGTFQGQSSWTRAEVTVPAENNGKTMRLVFTWRNDNTIGAQPPAAVDNIVLNFGSGVVVGSESRSGGLVGRASVALTINNSLASGNISSLGAAGGLVGLADAALIINNSNATGDVSGVNEAGGLLGRGQGDLTIGHSFATGDVSTANSTSHSGGLVGRAQARLTVNNSFATGDISGTSHSGGLAGFVNSIAAISNSYATGDVFATTNAGGLIGWAQTTADITRSYASGVITGATSGGIFGRFSAGTGTASYYNSDGASASAGTGTTSGIMGVPLANLKQRSTFAGWDFNNVWGITDGVSTPFLLRWIDLGDEFEILYISAQIYIGAQITPDVKIRRKSDLSLLEQGVDFSVGYGENRNVATGGVVSITGIGEISINFQILPRPLTVAGAVAENKVFDGTRAARITGGTLSGVIEGDLVSINREASLFEHRNVATAVPVSITLTGADAENYRVNQPGLAADITRRPLVISLNPKVITVILGDDAPDLQQFLHFNSFGEGDDRSIISGTINISHNYVAETSPIGFYPITMSGIVTAANYNISFDNQGLALQVGEAISVNTLTVSSIPNQTHTGEAIEPTVIVSHGETVLEQGVHYSLAFFNNINVGDQAAVVITGIGSGGFAGTRTEFFSIVDGESFIRPNNRQSADSRFGILLEEAVVSDFAKISVRTPEPAQITLRITDNLGNVVFATNGRCADTFTWNLTNKSGRFVSSGTYLVLVEARGIKGGVYLYSAKIGVNR